MSCSASDAAALRRRDRVASLASHSCFDVVIGGAIAIVPEPLRREQRRLAPPPTASAAATALLASRKKSRKETMKAHAFREHRALKERGSGDIAPAVLAIGHPSFPQVLIDTLRRTAAVGHCMVFTFDGERSTRCLLDIGNIPI